MKTGDTPPAPIGGGPAAGPGPLGRITDLLPFEDHWEVLDQLGQGGFGVVYRVRSRLDGRLAAAKVSLDPHPETDARTQREAQLATRLDHPNLVRFFGLFRDATRRLVLVYELVHGVELYAVLERGPVPVSDALEGIAQVAAGLDAIHAAGLLHRDLKPANVMLGRDGVARLVDYGLVRGEGPGGTMTAEGVIVGTPAYMAPEVLTGHRPGVPSDIYAMGAVAYAWLVGAPPFRPSQSQRLGELVRQLPPAPSTRRSGLPQALDRVVLGAMAKRPEDRPASGAALVAELRAALRGVSDDPAPGGQADRTVAILSSEVPLVGSASRATPTAQRAAALRTPSSRRRGPVSSRRRRAVSARGPWWAALVLVVGAGLAVLAPRLLGPQPVEGGSTSPPAGGAGVEPDGAPGEGAVAGGVDFADLAQRMRRELDDASLWLVTPQGEVLDVEEATEDQRRAADPFLGPDHATWPRLVATMPALGEARGWLAQGGDPLALPGSVQDELRRVDRWFQDQDLPMPFFPALYVRPAGRAVDVPSSAWPPSVPEGQRPALLARDGWAGAARREVLAALRACERLEAGYAARDFDEHADPALAGGRAVLLFERYSTAFEWADFRIQDRDGRSAYIAWAAEASQAAERAVYAVFRAMAEDPETAGETASMLLRIWTPLRLGLFGPIVVSDHGIYLGRRPEGSLPLLLRGWVLNWTYTQGRRMGLNLTEQGVESLSVILECLDRLDAGDPDLDRTWVLTQGLDSALELGDSVALDLWRRFDGEWDRLDAGVRDRAVMYAARDLKPRFGPEVRRLDPHEQLFDVAALTSLVRRLREVAGRMKGSYRAEHLNEAAFFSEVLARIGAP